MTLPNGQPDPFAGGSSTPSVSFKDKPHGTSYVLEVTEYPELVQSTDYETGKPAFWDDGNKKMSAVVKGTVVSGPDSVGEVRSVWASKPSALYKAIQDAQNAAGSSIGPGGRLTITYTHDGEQSNPRKAPPKQYSAVYAPPAAFGAPAQAAPPAAAAPVQAAAAPAAPKAKVNAQAYAAMVAAGLDVSGFEIG